MRIQIYHIPNVKEASKYPLSNNNNAHSITKHGVLGRLDVQIVALRLLHLVHPLKGHWVKKDAQRTPGALTFPLKGWGGGMWVGGSSPTQPSVVLSC